MSRYLEAAERITELIAAKEAMRRSFEKGVLSRMTTDASAPEKRLYGTVLDGEENETNKNKNE